MKKIFCSILFVCAHANFSMAQTGKIELYDLIKSLLPDSIQTDNNVSWTKASESLKGIKWKNQNVQHFDDGSYHLYGSSNIAITGKTFACGGSSSCAWHVSLAGNANGYSSFEISPDLSPNPEYQTTLAYLFNSHPYKSIVLKTCETREEFFYEVKMPGKKTFWMSCNIDGGSGGYSISITCFLNKKGMEIECLSD